MVERGPEKAGVGSSILLLGTLILRGGFITPLFYWSYGVIVLKTYSYAFFVSLCLVNCFCIDLYLFYFYWLTNGSKMQRPFDKRKIPGKGARYLNIVLR